MCVMTGRGPRAVEAKGRESRSQHTRQPKAGAHDSSRDAAERDRWGEPLPPFASTAIRSRRKGRQLWTPAFASQVGRVADHLVVSGVAEKTAAKYEGGFRDFVAYTDNISRDTEQQWPIMLDGSDPRREEDHLLRFVAYQGWLLGLSHSTVSGKLAAIRWQHVVEGLPNPLEGKLRLRAALRKLKKMKGDGHSKLPVTADMLQHVKRSMDMTNNRDVTVWAALCFGWFFCLRQSEYLADGGVFDAKRALCGWKVLPLAKGQPTAEWESADALSIFIEVAKTDQDRQGCTRTVHASGSELCVVEAYKQLRRMRGSTWDANGPLLEEPGGWIASREAVATALKKAAVELNFPASDFATHSLRIGGATALFGAGVPFEEVRRFGRWASDCWRRYVYESRESTRDFACKMAKSPYTMQMSAADYLAATTSRFDPQSAPAPAERQRAWV